MKTAWHLHYGGRDLLGEEPASSPFRQPAAELTLLVNRLAPATHHPRSLLAEVFTPPSGTLSMEFPLVRYAKEVKTRRDVLAPTVTSKAFAKSTRNRRIKEAVT